MPYSDKVLRDWYANILVKSKFEVEFWDISKILKKSESKPEQTYIDGIKILEKFSYKQLSNLLHDNRNTKTIYIIMASFHASNAKLYRILNKYNIFTVFFNWGDTPEALAFRHKSFLQKIKMLFNNQLPFKNSFRNIFGAIYCKIIKKLKLIKTHDIYFNAGIGSNSISNAKKTIDINLCDYDQFLENTHNKTELNQAVFLDSNLTENSDISLNDLKKINPKEYFKSLSRYFDYFEEKYNTEVIISAHPTSKYDNNEFMGRQVTRLKTAELVVKSKYVLSHHSTAISYAVLNYKPINFLMINDWIGEYEEYANHEISKSLGCNLINIDKIKSINDIKLSSVNKNLYDNYKYNYIVNKNSEGKTSSSIIIDEFKKYFIGNTVNG